VLSRNVIGSTATIALVMHPAQRLTGRITTPKGDPLSGALVYQGGTYNQRSSGVRCTRTNQEGRYELTDLEAWSVPNDRIVPDGKKSGRAASNNFYRQMPVWVYHADYGATYVSCRAVPGTMDVQMDAAGTLAGRVVDGATGQPVAGVSVWAVAAPSSRRGTTYGTNWAVTDANGKYKMAAMAGNVYRVQVDKQGFFATERPLSKKVTAGTTSDIPQISIAQVGTIRGRLVDAASGQPLHFPSKPRISISLGGPVSLQFGNQPWLAEVNADGTFERRAVPSGRSYFLSVTSSDPAVKDNRDLGELTIGAGETVEVELPVEPLGRQ
jgi:5-hydroxyisourate hydrolase-like protein (transthyretin family)